MIRIPKRLADLGLKINHLYYKQLLEKVYFCEKSPSWFDHRIDLYYHWPNNLFWLERGIFPRKYMFEGCRVLDLFCGDGFYSCYFYSTIAGHIDAIDKDPNAISHAKRWHPNPKVNYQIVDVVKQELPQPSYDVVVWYEGVEHLSLDEYNIAIQRIKPAIENGVLIGSTSLISSSGSNWEHKNEFSDVMQLNNFFSKDFADVDIHVTVYPVLAGGYRRTAHFTLRKIKM